MQSHAVLAIFFATFVQLLCDISRRIANGYAILARRQRDAGHPIRVPSARKLPRLSVPGAETIVAKQQDITRIDDGPLARIDGTLCMDGLPLDQIVAGSGTPAFVYSGDHVARSYRRIADAFSNIGGRVHYAVKANANLALLRLLVRLGSGFDVVSGGELTRVLKAGGDPASVVFAGVGKTEAELALAVRHRVTVHVESADELAVLAGTARQLGITGRFAVRINPDVEVDTHPGIATGHSEAKFGVPVEVARELLERAAKGQYPSLEAVGVHIHVGSQLPDPAGLAEATGVAAGVLEAGRAAGLESLDGLDIGGGLPVDYTGGEGPGPEVFADAIAKAIAEQHLSRPVRLQVEPGRALVARAGVLVASVLYRKHRKAGRMLVLDTGMHQLVRPAMYGSVHRFEAVRAGEPTGPTVLVGPICESSDVLGTAEGLPDLTPGDLVAVLDAGAYGMTMASNYNAQPRPPEIVVEGGVARVTRRRETWDEQLAWEHEADEANIVLPSRAARARMRIDHTAEFKVLDAEELERLEREARGGTAEGGA
jgi:diaminopimelate decarboxylase